MSLETQILINEMHYSLPTAKQQPGMGGGGGLKTGRQLPLYIYFLYSDFGNMIFQSQSNRQIIAADSFGRKYLLQSQIKRKYT